MEPIKFEYTVPGDDFAMAGEASADLKSKLKTMGITGPALRNISISLYEGEINLAIHAGGGKITALVYIDRVELYLDDNGPGIPDISLAMQEGYSSASNEVRQLGFGAGMGLPNMKKYSDFMDIQSTVGEGTHVKMIINL